MGGWHDIDPFRDTGVPVKSGARRPIPHRISARMTVSACGFVEFCELEERITGGMSALPVAIRPLAGDGS
ncbi:hypothetical protein CQ057_12485 [Ochrobactrum sp. MYb49]|nr:hypothetical protein CQ057_12485 [Ochrobactrum sp. MYb49]